MITLMMEDEMTYRVCNNSKYMLSYGADFNLEVYKEGTWEAALPENRPCILILYHLAAKTCESYPMHIELTGGRYRILKKVFVDALNKELELASEFTIL